MATTYWDFANNKPTGDMGLKADYKLQQVEVRVYDDTNFLSARYRAKGTYSDHSGMPYNVGGYTSNVDDYEYIWYRADQVNTARTWEASNWAQSNIMQNQVFALGTDYGMEVDDKWSLGVAGNTSYYRNGLPRNNPTGQQNPWCQMRTFSVSDVHNPWIQNPTNEWKEDWSICNASSLTALTWEIFLTVYVPVGTYTPDTSTRAWRLHPNRARSVYVDYGTTISQLLSNSKLPTGWKKDAGSVANPLNWVVNNGTYAGKKLSEVPTNTQITGYWDIRVRY